MALGEYILNGHEVVKPRNHYEVVACLNNMEARTVQKTVLVTPETDEEVEISTVFLCLGHSHSSSGPPIVFETMVFGGKLNDSQDRYATWDEAETGHREMVTRVWDSFLGTKPEVPVTRQGDPLIRLTWHDILLKPGY